MYLENLKTDTPYPFIYGLQYDASSRAVRFTINPFCIPMFQEINPKNLILRHCRERLGLINFEPDIAKNFGWENCSVNHGIVDGLLSISFPVKTFFTFTKKKCFGCHGKKKDWSGDPCYFCRGTGREFKDTTNIDAICATLNTLTRYLNWVCLHNETTPVPENKWGNQQIFLELDPRAGIGGECSQYFFSTIAMLPEDDEIRRKKNMLDLYTYIEGKEHFPKFKFHRLEYDFCCEVGNTGRFYIEVPGQNGCSIHMAHNSDFEFTCHNVDVPQQQLTLIAGLANITGEFFKRV